VNGKLTSVIDAERHWKAGETDDAMKFLDFVIERAPSFAMAWSDRGALRLQLGDKIGARSDALKALSLDANDSQAQETLNAIGVRTN
jgi:Flp pilus assembly protein TadD